ncbi:hypothetical protein LUZ63_011957 [Rhynchospora breviuscula]|uniref:Protein FAR1-RELATED SEQUENCE n=1 Tax=Rhynchospora breviuscula TaxID=2022672 RepID=A0A9Q0CJS4_9POAL|nr:hypothetical protein LUZ63_011957 [Rhynchospora breviuscula]
MEASRIMELHPQAHQHPLMEANVDLEEESINFWATLGVTPHVPVVDLSEQITHQALSLKQHIDPPDMPPPPPALPVAVRYDPLFPTDLDPGIEPFVGMEFESGEAAKTFYIAYAGRVGFSVRIARSRRSKCTESVIMLRFVCSREGFSREKQPPPGRKTRRRAPSVREGCQAMLEVIRRTGTSTGEAEKWVVTKLVKEHSHEVGLPGRVHYIATEGDAEVDPYVGMEFDSLEAAKTFYYTYANRVGFEARVRQSRRSLHDETMKMLKLVCSKHRYHSGKDNGNSNNGLGSPVAEPITKEGGGCEALFEIIRKEGDMWMVSKLVLEHTHDLTPAPPSKVRCVRSQGEILVIAKNFADTRSLLLNGHDLAPPKEIRYNDLGPDDFDCLLEYFTKAQEENPAFFYAVQIDKKTNRTTNVFWADAQARMAYHYFGDTVRLETRYRNDKELIPVVLFMGLNHHAHPVVFGCGLLVEESEQSFVWLFENWKSAMPGQQGPLSFVTELSRPMAVATAKVFSDTCHLFCSEHVLVSISEEMILLLPPDKCENNMVHSDFIEEMRSCIERSETIEAFESQWVMIIEKYRLQSNGYMCYLYDIKRQWVPAYTKDTFTGEVSGPYRVWECVNKVVEEYFTVKAQLKVAVQQLAQAVANWHEREHGADFVTLFQNPPLHTASPIEKQAAGIYSRVIFEKFQEEFMQSFGYYAEKLTEECGTQIVRKYRLEHSYDESNKEMHEVTVFLSEGVEVCCTCRKFESCGILCRHSLRIFVVEGVRNLPSNYILKRWTKHAKSESILDANFVVLKGRKSKDDLAVSRYNSLCANAMKCAKEGSRSEELYKVAKEAIQRALDEVMSAKPHRGIHALQGFTVPQKKQEKIISAGRKGVKRSGSPTSLTDDDIR